MRLLTLPGAMPLDVGIPHARRGAPAFVGDRQARRLILGTAAAAHQAE